MSDLPKKNPAKAKYQVLSDTLFNDIEKGKWQSGERLPSEDKLASELGYSLGTVQRALRDLTKLGVVERFHGSGTFVTNARAPEGQLRHFRFLDDDGVTLLPVFFMTENLEQTYTKGPWVNFLGEDNASFIKIQRMVSVNREYEIFSELYLPATKFLALLDMELADLDGVSIRDMLSERFNTPTLKTEQSITCSVFPPRVSRSINMSIGQFGMILTVNSASYRDIPIIWQRAFIPPNDRQMQIVTND